MAKRSSRSAPPPLGLFASVPAAPAPAPFPVPVFAGPPAQAQQRLRLEVDTLQRTIADLQEYVARPLTSWDQYDMQVGEANISMALLLRALSEWLPVDLRPVVQEFLDVRASIVLRQPEG